jgi:hypothetical protein
MLDNASALPSEPIHNLAKLAIVVDPAHRRLEGPALGRDVGRVPKGRENVPCSVESIRNGRVVVLYSPLSVSKL